MKKLTDFRARYGPWALVAGASAGLGAEYANQLAGRGLNLVLIARRKEELEELATKLRSEYNIEVRTLTQNLASDDIGDVVAQATSDIEVGLLVYNAATSKIGLFFATSLGEHLEEIAVNCLAPLTLTYLLGKRMQERKRGGIILMSSLSSTQGSAYISNYTATKAYNRLLGEGLWEELRTQGVDVLTSSPAAVSTPNYIASSPSSKAPSSTMTPRAVVTETLAALGRRAVVIPGASNRAISFIMQRILPHQFAIKLMGRVLRGMYG